MDNDTLISAVREVLSLDTPTSTSAIKTQQERAMKLREPLLTARVKAQRELATVRFKMRHPKDKEFTDFDRTIMLEGQTEEYMGNYELLKGLEKLLEERLYFLNVL